MKRALAFDEDVNNLYSLTFALTNIEWEVLTSTLEHNIVERVHKLNPSVILVTNNLPSQGTLVLCKILKTHPALKHIPIVCYGEKTIIHNETSSAGADFYCPMPFEIKKLKDIMAEAYAQYKPNNQIVTLKDGAAY